MEADFGGWATRPDIKCSDGRTIMPNAFQKMNGKQVPLVFQHSHNEIENVLGYAVLEHRDGGVYAHGYFNDTPKGQLAKTQVQHKDIQSLSIYANNLVEKGKEVVHGVIREVSLVLAGANPGAVIDFVRLAHGDGNFTDLDDEAVIHSGLALELEADSDKTDEVVVDDAITHAVTPAVPAVPAVPAASADKTVQDVYDSLDAEQKNVLHYMVGVALEEAANAAADAADAISAGQSVADKALADAAKHTDTPAEGDLTHKEGADDMSRNVFDQNDDNKDGSMKHALTPDSLKGIMADALKCGSLKEATENYAVQHGITNVDVLFPDAKAATGTIELEKRRTEWVSTVLNGTRHTPFSRIKTFSADLTQDEARAKGYIKGNYKLEEWFGVSKRSTSPTTIYKKQKLDRDDMLDITDFDIVSFLKGEMRLMTEEEVARAILIGDGRSPGVEDKIKDPLGAGDGAGVRSILNDHELFVTTLMVNVDDANSTYEEVVDAVMDGMEFYKGSGSPTFFTTVRELNKFLKAKDLNGQRYYANKGEVAQVLGVKDIVTVEPMNSVAGLIGIIVNLDDYNVGTDRGGELTMFEDFDIDYNQQKYLLETRMSGALVRPKAALVIKKTAAANVLVVPTKPTFVVATGVVTVPTVTGVVYKGADGTTTLTAGAQTALAAGASTTVYAVAAAGYYFSSNAEDSWSFTRAAA